MNWGNHREQTIRSSRDWGRGCWIDYFVGQAGRVRIYRRGVLAIVYPHTRRLAARSLFRSHGAVRRFDSCGDFNGHFRNPANRQLVRLGPNEVLMAFISVRDRSRLI